MRHPRFRNRIVDPTSEPGTRPSIQGYRFILLMLLLGVAAVNTGNNLIYLIVSMVTAMMIVSFMLVSDGLRYLSIQATAPHPVFAGQDTPVNLSVTRGKQRYPAFDLHLRMGSHLPTEMVRRQARIGRLDPEKEGHCTINYQPLKRGRLTLDRLLVSTGFPFGLILKTVRAPLVCNSVVYPSLAKLESLEPLLRGVSEGRPMGRVGPGDEYILDRRYRSGDSIRHIHWKATARTGRLMVKEYSIEEPRRITLNLETGKDQRPDLFEKTVSIASAICVRFIDEGMPVRLIAGSADTGLGMGSDHLYRMLDLLALVQASESPAHDAPDAGSFRILLTSRGLAQQTSDHADLVIDASSIV